MSVKDSMFFDTDMFIHKLSIDPSLRNSCELEFINNKPTSMSEFSLVEFKGNYISSLILLRKKIHSSSSFAIAYSRIVNSGGRKSILMLGQLMYYIDSNSFPVKPWDKAQNLLLTHLDAQIEIVWESLLRSVDYINRSFNCTRAKEDPQDNNGNWSSTISKCRSTNTNCEINSFILTFIEEIKKLFSDISKIPLESRTSELQKIYNISEKIIINNKFPFEGSTCRKVGDLLIALESSFGKGLISSNYKEHSILSKSLNYNFINYDVVSNRS
jgi:hypothetical protein